MWLHVQKLVSEMKLSCRTLVARDPKQWKKFEQKFAKSYVEKHTSSTNSRRNIINDNIWCCLHSSLLFQTSPGSLNFLTNVGKFPLTKRANLLSACKLLLSTQTFSICYVNQPIPASRKLFTVPHRVEGGRRLSRPRRSSYLATRTKTVLQSDCWNPGSNSHSQTCHRSEKRSFRS